MCCGTIGKPAMSHIAFATGTLYRSTSVVGFTAVAFWAWFSADASTAVAPSAYLIVVLIAHAASDAVIGFPSDHFVFGRSLNVQTLPPAEAFQDLAQSPSRK